MEPRRVVAVSTGAALGCVIAGGVAGVGLGLLAPDALRFFFQAGDDPLFRPAKVGFGAGALAGFAAGAVVVAAGLAAALAPGLRNWRPFARGVLRPSVGGLVLVVAFAGLGFASLRTPTGDWAEGWFGLTALALAWATLVASTRPPGRRGFAAGFAAFGWAYLLLSLFPESRAQLPTARGVALLERRISGEWRPGVEYLEIDMQAFPAHRSDLSWKPVMTNRGGIPSHLKIDTVQPEFRRIAHSILTLLLATLGGALADSCLVRRRSNRTPTGATSARGTDGRPSEFPAGPSASVTASAGSRV